MPGPWAHHGSNKAHCRPLTTKDIEKHFADFSIEPETANHTLIKSLSGGQKVKVVLAASLWLNPHLVILDEPTNYLDRDGLGALTNAIHEFNELKFPHSPPKTKTHTRKHRRSTHIKHINL